MPVCYHQQHIQQQSVEKITCKHNNYHRGNQHNMEHPLGARDLHAAPNGSSCRSISAGRNCDCKRTRAITEKLGKGRPQEKEMRYSRTGAEGRWGGRATPLATPSTVRGGLDSAEGGAAVGESSQPKAEVHGRRPRQWATSFVYLDGDGGGGGGLSPPSSHLCPG
jgi:hypothetical protein